MYFCRLIRLFMAFKNADVSIEVICLDLGTAAAHSPAREAVRAVAEMPVVLLRLHGTRRKRGHFKVAVDVAVECFETEVSGKSAHKAQFNIAVYRAELRILPRVFPEANLHRAIDGPSLSLARNVHHLDSTVYIADRKVS